MLVRALGARFVWLAARRADALFLDGKNSPLFFQLHPAVVRLLQRLTTQVIGKLALMIVPRIALQPVRGCRPFARKAGADSSTDEAIAKPSFRERRTEDDFYLPNWGRFPVGYFCHFSF